MVVGLALPPVRYGTADSRVRFVKTLVDRVGAQPGVVAAGVSNRGPLSGEGSNLGLEAEGGESGSSAPVVDYRCVTPDFFRAIGIPLVAGRLIADSDRDHPVSVISAETARRIWPGQDSIGRRFRLGGDAYIDVVGVVGDVRSTLSKNPNMTVYVPFWQRDRASFALHVRTAAAPRSVANLVRDEIRRLDRELVVPQFRALDDIVDSSVAQRRFQLSVVLFFAACALLLAAVGIYGVVSQAVAQRSGEIGLRMALGATRAHVWALAARHGLIPVLAGLLAGLAGATAVTRLVSGLLFGIAPLDPATFAVVAVVVVIAAAAACWLPALRASRVDPLVALRYQ